MSVFGELFDQEMSKKEIWGVTTGIVKENWNQDFPGKIKAEIDLGAEEKKETGWIPVMTPYGGNGFGMYTLPEIGAQVVIAFQMGDPNCPIVIGSLWNNVNTMPADTAKESNTVKRFKTKGGCELLFSEEENKAKVNLHTPNELSVLLDDEAKTITIADKEKKNGILVDTDKGIVTLMAKEKIQLKVNDEVMVSLDGTAKSVQISGNTVKAEGKQTLNMKGQSTKIEGSLLSLSAESSLKMESSGIAELKGTMVKIN